MTQFLRGPKPYAVVLCRFNDVPETNFSTSYAEEFFVRNGAGGLFDYWRDISFGQISLEGSQVFGWYTMQYSWAKDSAAGSRDTWIAEARRLLALHNIDLSPFRGVVAVINGEADDSASGRIPTDLAISLTTANLQYDWYWCSKCQGLAYDRQNPGPCVAGGVHDGSVSSNYGLSINNGSFPGQDGWRWCRKCQGLAYNGLGITGPCQAGGLHDHTTSGDYRLGMSPVGFRGQDQWKWCRKCQALAYAGGSVFGPCLAGGQHDHSASADYSLPLGGNTVNVEFVGHESGHTLGLYHSWSGNPDREYGDPWDIMSAFETKSGSNGPYSPAGPGLNSPTLNKLGWLTDERVFIHHPGHGVLFHGTKDVEIASLYGSSSSLPLMIRVLTPERIYTVEFRQKRGWDIGLDRDTVLIHELRSYYTHAQQNWRWCKKCQGLHYAGYAACPAGGLHDLSTSMNYSLSINDPSTAGQDNWRWCPKCQLLAYAGSGAPGPCPAGGLHDHSPSGDYRLTTAGSGQDHWKWCHKCQGLNYAGVRNLSSCAAGGTHNVSTSADYKILHDIAGAGQDGWRWCSKCQGLAYSARSVCPAGGSHVWEESGDYGLPTDAVSPGQPGWFWCSKCMGLAYGGTGSSGTCPSGGGHQLGHSLNYCLPEARSDINGQAGWRQCGKCQGLFFEPNAISSRCPAGDQHVAADATVYLLPNWGDDRTYLLGGEMLPSASFTDPAGYVTITVVAIDSIAGVATIKLSGYEIIEHGPPPH